MIDNCVCTPDLKLNEPKGAKKLTSTWALKKKSMETIVQESTAEGTSKYSENTTITALSPHPSYLSLPLEFRYPNGDGLMV